MGNMVHEDVMTRTDEKTPRDEAGQGADPAGSAIPSGHPGQMFQAEQLFEALRDRAGERRGLPPVQDWHPARTGRIDIRIARDGSWHYLGSPITRKPMVRLFSTILRREDDGSYHLVTPAEKLRIEVEDAPFVAVEMARQGAGAERRLVFRTNVDDVVEADAEHPIRVETDPETGEPAPYIHVRNGLEALISRALFYDLVELAEPARIDGRDVLAVRSAGMAFALGPIPDEAAAG